jgi:hypothetical protein
MSGAVSRLTNRLFGLAPVARVRLPARFEVSGAALAGSPEPAEIAAEAPAAMPPRSETNQVVERWTPPAVSPPRPAAGQPQRPAAAPDEPRMAAPPMPEPAQRQPRAPDAPPLTPRPAAARPPREDASPRAAAPPAGTQPVTSQPPQPLPAVAGTGAAALRQTPAPPPEIAVLPEPQRRRPETPITAPAAPAPQPPGARPAAPVQPAPAVPEPVAATPAAEPLEIVIGRIDIRAPAPRAPAAPSVSAGLQRIPSLAAYLATKR